MQVVDQIETILLACPGPELFAAQLPLFLHKRPQRDSIRDADHLVKVGQRPVDFPEGNKTVPVAIKKTKENLQFAMQGLRQADISLIRRGRSIRAARNGLGLHVHLRGLLPGPTERVQRRFRRLI